MFIFSRDFLPNDAELMRREKAFLDLFAKFDIDEGIDPEIAASDDSTASDGLDDSHSEPSYVSSNESVACFDVEEELQALEPFIKNRIYAWSYNGTNLQLKTVPPNVTVVDWLKQNKKFSSTGRKSTQTVIDEKSKTITITKKEIKTKRSSHSIDIGRNKRQALPAETEESASERPKNGKKMKIEHMEQVPNRVLDNSTKFVLPKLAEKTAKKNSKSPEKVKRLPPRKKYLRQKKTKKSNEENNSDPQIFDNGNKALPDNVNSIHETFDHINPKNEVSHQTQEQTTSSNATKKPNGTEHGRIITVYSPSAPLCSGQSIGLTTKYLLSQISTEYRQCQTLVNEVVCKPDQSILCKPPESCSTDDDETDLLLTCFRRTGHFWKVNTE